MKKNYRAVYGDIPKDHQLHHVVPDNVVQRNSLVREAYDRGIYDLDRASNLKSLPEYGNPNELVHRGPHRKWDEHVEEVLDNKKKALLKKCKVKSIEQLPDEALEKALKSAEQKLQRDLVNVELGRKEGWLKPEPTGLKVSENEDSQNIATT